MPLQNRQQKVQKIKGGIVHPLMMNHDAHAAALSRFFEFRQQTVPSLPCIFFPAGMQVDIDGEVGQGGTWLRSTES